MISRRMAYVSGYGRSIALHLSPGGRGRGEGVCYLPSMQHMTSTQLYLRLLRYVKPYWGVFALSILGMLIYRRHRGCAARRQSSLSSTALSSTRTRFSSNGCRCSLVLIFVFRGSWRLHRHLRQHLGRQQSGDGPARP